MLGVWLDRKHDLQQRINRSNRAWFAVKRRLRGTKLPKKTQARIIEACIESTMLFDCATRPWHNSEIKKMQQSMDKCYRFAWMNKKMEERRINMYGVRSVRSGLDRLKNREKNATEDWPHTENVKRKDY